MMSVAAGKYYVYGLRDPSRGGYLFYVGKGSATRMTSHERAVNNGHKLKNHRLYKILKNMNSNGVKVRYQIFVQGIEEQKALDIEKGLIKIYGRADMSIGLLCNLTDGGEGPNNWICTEELREKRRKSATGRKHSDRVRKQISESNTGKKKSEETRRKISEAGIGREVIEESKEKRRLTMLERYGGFSTGFKHTAETKERLRIANTGKKRTQETKDKISLIGKGRVLSEEHKRKIGEANLGRKHTQEMKDKISKIHKNKEITKKHREAISQKLTGRKVKVYIVCTPVGRLLAFSGRKDLRKYFKGLSVTLNLRGPHAISGERIALWKESKGYKLVKKYRIGKGGI